MIKQTMYAEHIDQICLKNEIVVGKHSSGGRSWRKKRHMNIREVKTGITYAVALHEAGIFWGSAGVSGWRKSSSPGNGRRPTPWNGRM